MENKNPNFSGVTTDNSYAGVATPVIPQNITSASLQPTTPIQLPQVPTMLSAPSLNTSIPSPIPTAESIITDSTTQTPAELRQQAILDKIASLTGTGQTKTTLQNTAEQKAGIPALTSTLNDLNTQLEGLNNQDIALQNETMQGGTIENKQQQDILNRGITTKAGLAPLTAADLRNNQVKRAAISASSLTTKSALFGAQGKYAIAKDAADKAAEAQYEVQQQQIDTAKAQLDAIAPKLKKEQEAQFAIRQAALQDRQTQIDNAKESKKSIIGMVTVALGNLGKFPPEQQAAIQYAAQQALAESNKDMPDLTKAFSLVGAYQTDPVATQNAILEQQMKQEQLRQAPLAFATDQSLKNAQIANTNANIRKINAEITKTNTETQGLQVPTVSNPQASQYSGALSVILGSTKFTKEQKAAVVNAVNNGSDPVAVIKNQAKDIMGQTEATKVTGYETAKTQLTDIQAALKEFYANGGKTSYFTGNYEKVINRLGQIDNPKLVDLGVQIQSALQIYRNAVSGTAYSVQEGADIASIFPGINNTEGLNMARLKGRLTAFDSTIDGAYRTALGSSYDDIKKTNSPSSPSSSFDNLANDINPAPNGTDAYIPRSVWTTVQDKDGLLKYVKSLGYNLLVQ